MWLMCLLKRLLLKQLKILYSILLLCTALLLNSSSASLKKTTGKSSSTSYHGLLLNSTPVLPESPSLFRSCVNESDWRTGLSLNSSRELLTGLLCALNASFNDTMIFFFNYHSFFVFKSNVFFVHLHLHNFLGGKMWLRFL